MTICNRFIEFIVNVALVSAFIASRTLAVLFIIIVVLSAIGIFQAFFF